MAAQEDAAAQGVDPQLVANSFVEQYYKVLHDFPDLVHRFYQDSSILGRPGPNGLMTSISTMNAINEQIMSLDYHHLQTEILTVDAQGSYCSGVIVLVTGFLTGKDNVKRKFAQSFFLAPQEKGFFVLNDVFRYVDYHKDQSDHQVVVAAAINGGDESAPATPLESDTEATHAIPNYQSILINHDPTTSSAHEDHPNNINNNGKELEAIVDPSILQNRKANYSTQSSVPDRESHEVAANPPDDHVALKQTDTQPVAESVTIDSQIQDASSSSKKSFASIVNALKDNSAPFKAPTPKPVERSRVASAYGASAPTPTGDNASKRHDNTRPVSSAKSKGFSIFVANLPIDATIEQLQEMFVKFGPIIPNGVQIRTNKLRPNCFGFVEFETVTSMLSAIQYVESFRISNVIESDLDFIAIKKAFVRIKRTLEMLSTGSDSTLKPTPIGYENNNYKVTSNNPVGYPSSNFKVTSNGRNPPVMTGRNAAGESTRVHHQEGGRRVAYQAKV
ncbi:hypothetical protein JRO89_XS04G0017400 [Xanthoceras sorbifolium]|uniref:Uncharacterized protein n=1 Tax=Xanthoceras sorbifolium TaxID=99658 RepID=A0ABQ8I4K5_9ROSI|nr:hypothetical protein JRO89_XS04G0017400 [Xanthoceras sorbifolium]